METISNQAHVSYSYEGSDVTRTNHSNIVNSTIKDAYSISVEKTSSSDCFRAGDTITYFVNVTNNGCSCFGHFHITDNLGGENYLSYVPGSSRIFIDGTMTSITPSNTSPLEYDFSRQLERDNALIIQFNVVVDDNIPTDVTEIVNLVTVEATPCSCDSSSTTLPVTESASLTLQRCEFAEIVITKQASSDSVCCNQELDYYITLTNTGTIDATNVVVTDTLPTNFTTLSISMENNGNVYLFDPSEYTIDEANLLTLPTDTGTAILVPAIAPGIDNTTRIKIHGHM